MLKVAKFGGSSLADSKQFEKVKKIIESDPARACIVVSAAGKRFPEDNKITDLLYLCHAHVTYGVSAESVFEMIRSRYIQIRDDLGLTLDLEKEFDELYERMVKGISQDELVSRGEYFSAKIMAAYLGYDFLDSSLWVTFNYDGTVNEEVSYDKLQKLAEGRKVVIPGFYGVMPDGTIKLMSRGGSDVTGAFAAAALDADFYENWTDVSGILMADPRIVKKPKAIRYVTYSELRELSYIGAQVLNEDTIFPVRKKNIALNIRNTNDPDNPGTMIKESFDDDPNEGNFITGIAGKKGFTIITITKSGISSEVGSLSHALSLFEKYGVSIAYAPCGIDCFSMVVEDEKLGSAKYAILADIQKTINPDDIQISENIAILAIVGRKMVFRTGSSGKIFQALGERNVNIRMISQGPEELNIIIGVNEHDFKDAIRAIYEKYIG